MVTPPPVNNVAPPGYIYAPGGRLVVAPPGYKPPTDPGSGGTAPGTPPAPSFYDQVIGTFKGSGFEDTQGFQDIVKNWATHGGPVQNAQQNLKQYTDAFTQMYTNQVGAAPTKEAYNQFFNQILQPYQPWAKQIDPAQLQTGLNQFIGGNYSSTARDVAEQKAKDQATQAVAPGSAFDDWQKSYMSSLNDTEKSLTDYQTRLFEKLRPNLLTSLKAQGLLDTGALDQAFAGAAGDANAATSNFMANARTGANMDIASKKLAITSSPTNFALGNTFSAVPNLTSAGQSALNSAFGNYQLTRNFDYNSQNQPYVPSLLQQTGGMMAGGLLAGFGQGYGSRMGR